MKIDKVYVVLNWFYEGDSNLVDSFRGVFRTYEEALAEAKEYSYYYDIHGNKIEKPLEFITFINYKTMETSDVYIEGYDPVEYEGYSSGSKMEIREIILR
jgi:hypothetical protein